MRRYFAVIDRLGQKPGTRLTPLKQVATGNQLTAEELLLDGQHQRGERQTGATRVVQVKVQSINLDDSNPQGGRAPTVTVDVCWDVSAVDVVDKTGRSIVSSSRPDSGWTRYSISNYRYTTHPTGGWRIASGQDLEQKSCVAS